MECRTANSVLSMNISFLFKFKYFNFVELAHSKLTTFVWQIMAHATEMNESDIVSLISTNAIRHITYILARQNREVLLF